MNYYTLIVLASEHELPPIIKEYPNARYVYTGIGMVNATATLIEEIKSAQAFLPHYDLRVLNIGTCFGISAVKPGTVLHIHEVNYDIEPNLVNTVKYALTPAKPAASRNKLISTNKFVTPENYLMLSNPQVDAADMEAFAVAEVCKRYHIPLKVVKIVSDSLTEPSSPLDWKNTLRHLHKIIKQEVDTQMSLDDYFTPCEGL